jgi:hypothetical protein
MLARARALACAENQRQRTQKQEAADGSRNMCLHVAVWRRAMRVRAQHRGQAGKSVCELSASVAMIEMPCEFGLPVSESSPSRRADMHSRISSHSVEESQSNDRSRPA